jgi:hypothetical protein
MVINTSVHEISKNEATQTNVLNNINPLYEREDEIQQFYLWNKYRNRSK